MSKNSKIKLFLFSCGIIVAMATRYLDVRKPIDVYTVNVCILIEDLREDWTCPTELSS